MTTVKIACDRKGCKECYETDERWGFIASQTMLPAGWMLIPNRRHGFNTTSFLLCPSCANDVHKFISTARK